MTTSNDKKNHISNIHIMHTSMSFDMSKDGFESDLRNSLGRNPDLLTLTEATNHIGVFRSVCRDLGYRPIVEERFKAVPIAVNTNDDKIKVRDQGSIYLFAGGAGLYPNKGVVWAEIEFHEVALWHHVQHWIPIEHLAQGYNAKHIVQSKAMVTQVVRHSKTGGYATFAGDVNDDDQANGRVLTQWNAIFRAGGLQTIWDEYKTYPGTMGANGRTMDVVGRYVEKGIKGTRYKVWAKQNSDHRPVSAWYDIDTANAKKRYNSGGTPTPGDHAGGGAVDDPFNTDTHDNGGGGGSGNGPGSDVDWADYLNADIYPLNYLVDDTDTDNG